MANMPPQPASKKPPQSPGLYAGSTDAASPLWDPTPKGGSSKEPEKSQGLVLPLSATEPAPIANPACTWQWIPLVWRITFTIPAAMQGDWATVKETCLAVCECFGSITRCCIGLPNMPGIANSYHHYCRRWLVQISTSMPVPSNNTPAWHCPSVAKVQPSKPLWSRHAWQHSTQGSPSHHA
jgi:hypothetical protein